MSSLLRLLFCCVCLGFLSGNVDIVWSLTGAQQGVPQSRLIAEIDPGGAFAVDHQGQAVAYVRAGLNLLLLPASEGPRRLTEELPTALSWSADGRFLAALYRTDNTARVVVHDRSGQTLASTEIAGRVTQLTWAPDGNLLFLVLRLHPFSFGVNQKLDLLNWNLQDPPDRSLLFETTLKHATVKSLGESLDRLFRFDLSPLGGDIVFTQLSDPPVIQKRLRVIHRNLQSGKERQLLSLPLSSNGPFWTSDNTTLLVSDGISTFRFDPRRATRMTDWPHEGGALSAAHNVERYYIDGVLYLDGQEPRPIKSGRAHFSGDGSLLLVAAGSSLYAYRLPDNKE